MSITGDDFPEDERFFWFVRRVNKYIDRYSFLPDGEEKIFMVGFIEDEDWYQKRNLFKIYDKYTPTILQRQISWEETRLQLNRLNEDDLLYQRLIYEYCHN